MESERVITNKSLREDAFEKTIRPDSFDEYIGQTEVKNNMSILLQKTKNNYLKKQIYLKIFHHIQKY